MKFAPSAFLLLYLGSSRLALGAPADYFGVQVVDESTGRGVPLVELKTTAQERFLTDSQGFVAIGAPDLMGQSTYFSVSSPGYELDADGFGNRGQALEVKAGGRAQIKIKRQNIAERLYRLTGSGIYRDSVLLGEAVPLAQPLLSGGVTGQDTVMAAPYRGKIYWFWGDTNRTSYPLGNFATSGATSLLPQQGGLDPNLGVNYTYWTSEGGFSKKMIPLEGLGGPVWVGGLFTLGKDKDEELWTHFVHLDGAGQVGERGLARFNDERAVFEKKLLLSGPLYPNHQTLRVLVKGVPYLYFGSDSLEAMPLVRVRADRASVLDPLAYEAFTPLVAGTQKVGDNPALDPNILDRDAQGRLRYAWKANTATLDVAARQKAIAAGQIRADEVPFALRDAQTGAPIQSHGGSVHWNAFRNRWVMITTQANGASSYLGEVWFAEADTPLGPWLYARRVATHPKYTFYNPAHHPFFDQNGGRLIYFEGTYTSTYSGAETPTPRYDYNQLSYRLDLADARLMLPAPVYRLKNSAGETDYATRETLKAGDWARIEGAPFFAIPTARVDRLAAAKMRAVYRDAKGKLTLRQPTDAATGAAVPLFYAWPAAPGEKDAPHLAPLFQFRHVLSGQMRYSTDNDPKKRLAEEEMLGAPLCRVWRNPLSSLALDLEAAPEL